MLGYATIGGENAEQQVDQEPQDRDFNETQGRDTAGRHSETRTDTGHRGGTGYSHLMHEIAPHLTRQQMEDVVRWYGSLAGEARRETTAPATGQP